MARAPGTRLASALLAVCVWATIILPAQAAPPNGNATFQWAFAFNMVSTDLTTCQNYSITVSSRNSSNASAVGVPPYYMIAFSLGGPPTTSLIGSDPSSLTWRVNQPNGSSLILAVADSIGNTGGNSVSLFTVTGGDSSCIPSPPSRNFYIASNVTGTLETCQNLGLRVYGGTKPYNLSISAVNSPVITNVTLGPDDDVFTWPNRADPNGQLLVAVSDANGWGNDTGIFHTKGSTNVTCTGLRATSGNSANINQHPAPPPKPVNRGVIAGVVVAACVVLILLAAGFFLWRRRMRILQEHEPAYLPDAWSWPTNQISVNVKEEGPSDEFSPYHDQPHLRPSSRETKLARERQWMAQARGQQSWGTGARPGSSSSYGYGDRNDSGNIGMALLSNRDSSSGLGSGSGSGEASSGRGKARNMSNPLAWTGNDPIIIQHEDAGEVVEAAPVVQEVPPPYRGLPASPPVSPPGAIRHGKQLPRPPMSESSMSPTSRPSSSGIGADPIQSRYSSVGGV